MFVCYVCIIIYMYIYIHTYIHTYIRTYIHVCVPSTNQTLQCRIPELNGGLNEVVCIYIYIFIYLFTGDKKRLQDI